MIFIILLILLFILSYNYDIKGVKDKNNRWYKILLVLFILLSGLRYRIGGDSIAYLYYYYNTIPYLSDFCFEEFPEYHYEPFFLLFNMIVKSLGGKFFVVLFIHAIVVNVLIFKYFKKHSQFPFLCILIYYVWMYALFNFEVMRASISIVICLFANDLLLEKKWIKGYLLYILAIGFHYSAVAMLLTPFLFRLKVNKFGYFFLLLSFIAGFWIAAHLNKYLFLFELTDSTTTSDKLDYYMSSDSLSNSIDLQGYLLHVIPAFLYPIIAFKIIKRKNEKGATPLIMLEPLIMIGLMYQLMTNSILMLYRVTYFFVIYLIMCYAELIAHIIKSNKHLNSLAVIRAIIFLLPFINNATSYYRAIYDPNQQPAAYNFRKYVPYSTVFDRTKDPIREKVWGMDFPTTVEEY